MISRILTILSIVLVLATGSLNGQTLCVGVASPTADSDGIVDDAVSKTVVTKLLAVLAKHGVAGDGSDFVVVPTILISEDDMVESGMVNLYKVSGSLTLVLTQLSTGKSFGSVSIPIRGTGRRFKSAAVKSAMGSINVNDPALITFLDEAKGKVIDYYSANFNSIIDQAKTATRQGNYEEALALLSSIPDGMPQDERVNSEITSTFKAYLDENCKEALIRAKAAISKKDYERARYLLTNVEPNSSCYPEVMTMLQSINNEIKAAENREHADMVRRENNAAALRKATINAARDVAKAYYKRTYPNYTIFFR